jgi:hypothetical protein
LLLDIVSTITSFNNKMPPTTSAEEWMKVADAVERRKIQNRNAQRKYRMCTGRVNTFLIIANG